MSSSCSRGGHTIARCRSGTHLCRVNDWLQSCFRRAAQRTNYQLIRYIVPCWEPVIKALECQSSCRRAGLLPAAPGFQLVLNIALATTQEQVTLTDLTVEYRVSGICVNSDHMRLFGSCELFRCCWSQADSTTSCGAKHVTGRHAVCDAQTRIYVIAYLEIALRSSTARSSAAAACGPTSRRTLTEARRAGLSAL